MGGEWIAVRKPRIQCLSGCGKQNEFSDLFLVTFCKLMEVLLVELMLGLTVPKGISNHYD